MNLNQITVPSNDVPLSIEFYERLGLKLIVHTTDNYARFVCPDGQSTFSIQHTDNQIPANGIHVYFECDQLDQLVEKLSSSGIIFDELPNDKPWLWREAHLTDPFGNKLVLYYAGENRVNPPWRKH